MPIGRYTGTTGAHRVALPVLRSLYDNAESVIEFAAANPDPGLLATWFGSRTSSTEVKDRIGHLRTYVAAGPVDIESRNQGTLGMSDLSDPARKILIGWWFSLSWFNTGERVQTIIHELAHKALDARDKKIGDDYCYKHKALELARLASRSREALENAENWGYFIANHRFLMPDAPARRDPDWSSIIAANVDRKGQPGAELTQDPALIDGDNPRW